MPDYLSAFYFELLSEDEVSDRDPLERVYLDRPVSNFRKASQSPVFFPKDDSGDSVY